METLYFFLASGTLGAILFFVLLIMGGHKKEEPKTETTTVAEPEPKGNGYLLEGYGPPERNDGAGVCSILLSVYRSLKKQKAAGFRNWISSCIERIQKGYDVPPEIALLALKKTRDELLLKNGRRLDLNELGRAILALEVETGEWG